MLRMDGLSKAFGPNVVLKQYSLRLDPGSTTAVTGPVGCGKTTLLRLIAGLEIPDAGSIAWGEQVWSSPRAVLPPWRRPSALVFQQPTLWPHLTVRGQVEFVLQSASMSRQERRRQAEHVLSRLTLHALADRYPAELSGGQQQAVAVARALVRGPDLLLLDEPFSQMDDAARNVAWTCVGEFQARNAAATVLVVTHQTEWARRSCRSVLELTGGTNNP